MDSIISCETPSLPMVPLLVFFFARIVGCCGLFSDEVLMSSLPPTHSDLLSLFFPPRHSLLVVIGCLPLCSGFQQISLSENTSTALLAAVVIESS